MLQGRKQARAPWLAEPQGNSDFGASLENLDTNRCPAIPSSFTNLRRASQSISSAQARATPSAWVKAAVSSQWPQAARRSIRQCVGVMMRRRPFAGVHFPALRHGQCPLAERERGRGKLQVPLRERVREHALSRIGGANETQSREDGFDLRNQVPGHEVEIVRRLPTARVDVDGRAAAEHGRDPGIVQFRTENAPGRRGRTCAWRRPKLLSRAVEVAGISGARLSVVSVVSRWSRVRDCARRGRRCPGGNTRTGICRPEQLSFVYPRETWIESAMPQDGEEQR